MLFKKPLDVDTVVPLGVRSATVNSAEIARNCRKYELPTKTTPLGDTFSGYTIEKLRGKQKTIHSNGITFIFFIFIYTRIFSSLLVDSAVGFGGFDRLSTIPLVRFQVGFLA